jgi:hypothetical protein
MIPTEAAISWIVGAAVVGSVVGVQAGLGLCWTTTGKRRADLVVPSRN